MPNGAYAISTMAVNEGRASRIADYNKGTFYRATPRGPGKLYAASGARLKRGIALRKKMAREGRMIHGAGSTRVHNVPPGGAYEVASGNRVRGSAGGGYARRGGATLTSHWGSYKAPSERSKARAAKNTGMYTTGKKK